VSPERTDTPMRRRAFPTEVRDGMLRPDDVALATIRLIRSDLTGQVVDVKQHDIAAAAANEAAAEAARDETAAGTPGAGS
jgi:2-C-methyl-D-erythritol 4-phosphate cytidylyltransferase